MLATSLAVTVLVGVGVAQRPSNASTCDYYAAARYGVNNSDTQLQLVQGIVSLAFAGGEFYDNNGVRSNVSTDITGILNPGTFQNTSVDLRPWFNGTLASTNLNNQPVGINWLDGGGSDPLFKYLGGKTQSLVLTNTTNQYRLFAHFFVAFSKAFGCSNPPKPLPSETGPLSLAYVHKYMGLNYTNLGYFIDQLSRSASYYGFSDQDSRTFNNRLNSLYNVRCAPALTLNPAQGPQLLSLCQADTCPLAVPTSDCAAYVNLTANGVSGSASASGSAPSSTSTSAPSSTSAASSSTTTTAAASTSLSTATIAGIAIGSAIVLILIIIAVILLRRKKRSKTPGQPPPEPHFGPIETPIYDTYSPRGTMKGNYGVNSYLSTGPTMAEMDSPNRSGVSSPEIERANLNRWTYNSTSYGSEQGGNVQQSGAGTGGSGYDIYGRPISMNPSSQAPVEIGGSETRER